MQPPYPLPACATDCAAMGPTETSTKPSFVEALAVWGKIGVLSFGGPAGQIALMHRVLVEERRWIARGPFSACLELLHAAAGTGSDAARHLCRLAAARHARAVSPRASCSCCRALLIVLALSIAYAFYGQVPLVEAAFVGIKAAVLVIVVEALLRVARRALRGPYDVAIAAAAFVAIFFFAAPFPLIIAAAAVGGVSCAAPRQLPRHAPMASRSRCRCPGR